MKKIFPLVFIFFCTTNTKGQNTRKINTFLTTQFNNTINDVTIGNNPWAIGIGIQSFINNKTKFRPTIEITRDAYLTDDKVFITDNFGKELNTVESMTNIFMGTSFNVKNNAYISFTVGPSFLGEQTLFGIKPSVGYYFSKNKKFAAKVSYINIFNRGKIIKENFTSWNIAFGIKLF
jgi:hypothetical protein